MKLKFIDLFAGTGGIRIGFQQACKELGIDTECLLSSEIDKAACETYKLNFGEYPEGDIREIKKIPDFDFLLAGFPCQPFSYAGKQRGFGDTRGTLFFEIQRILKDHKPKAFLLENVRGLTTHDKGRTFKTIIGELESLGYGVTYLLLNSSNFGVPQNRVRIYILGLLGKTPITTLTSDKGSSDSHKFKLKLSQSNLFGNYEYKVVKDILEDEDKIPEKYYCTPDFTAKLRKIMGNNLDKLAGVRLIDYRNGESIHSWQLGLKGECTKDEIELMNALVRNRRKKIFGTHQDGKRLSVDQIKTFHNTPHILETLKSLEKKGYIKAVDGAYNPVAGNMSFQVFKFLDPNSISITLVSSDAHKLGVVVNNKPRRITPREAARLQGYPETFILHPKDESAYRQFGNAVSVPVMKAVLQDFIKNNIQKKSK
ncbi:MAG: DNA (cytosine-5-)-methyltransferase [Pseudomonadales bacterium]|nr:DNA (cytosine-5-)-methyltransferase [Pseudomonadales bacterium]